MNELLEKGDIRGFKELVKENRKEAVVAANYVNAKYRYLAQWIASATLDKTQEQELRKQDEFLEG
jgi:hypothetical protein